MRISELAVVSGVPASTLRYYEAEGLLPAARATNGYRDYGPDAVDRLAFIGQAKHLDLTLTDVRELVDAWASKPCASVRATYRPMLRERAVDVAQRIDGLREVEAHIDAALRRLDALPDRDDPCEAGCAFLDAQPDPVVVCSLDGADHRERIEAWHALVRSGTRADVPRGFAVTLPVAQLPEASRLAADEQRCCPFLGFELRLDGAWFVLTVTAPSNASGFLDDLVPA